VPPRDWKQRIADILEAIERIQRYTRGMDLDSFSADDRTVDAVVRNITVIGEAARSVPDDVRRAHPEIPWGSTSTSVFPKRFPIPGWPFSSPPTWLSPCSRCPCPLCSHP
jgi:hypothetical protein